DHRGAGIRAEEHVLAVGCGTVLRRLDGVSEGGRSELCGAHQNAALASSRVVADDLAAFGGGIALAAVDPSCTAATSAGTACARGCASSEIAGVEARHPILHVLGKLRCGGKRGEQKEREGAPVSEEHAPNIYDRAGRSFREAKGYADQKVE